MGKYKIRVNREYEPLEYVVYGALIYCLCIANADMKEQTAICEWCNPKLEFMSTEVLEDLADAIDRMGGVDSEPLATIERTLTLTLELRHQAEITEETVETAEKETEETEEGSKETDEMCVQSGSESAEG